MPSQPVVTNSAWQLIFAQIAFTTSISKPTIWPVAGSTLSIGGEVVSEPTFSSLPPRSAADAPPETRAAIASAITSVFTLVLLRCEFFSYADCARRPPRLSSCLSISVGLKTCFNVRASSPAMRRSRNSPRVRPSISMG